VSSVERIDGTPTNFGHFVVEYTYDVNGTSYSGRFRTYLSESLDFLHARDIFPILYNPANPSRSCYPGVVGPWSLRLMAAGATVAGLIVLGLAAMAVNYLLRFV